MFAESLVRDYGVLIGAISAFILSVTIATVVWRKQWKSITASVGDLKVSMDQSAGQIEQINKAVNKVPEGERTLVERVGALESGQQWEHNALQVIASQIGVTLPPPPHRARWFH